VLAAALILLVPGARVHADDPIAEWLKQDESDSQKTKYGQTCMRSRTSNCKTFSKLGAIKQTATN
jgi:hypothetical protein